MELPGQDRLRRVRPLLRAWLVRDVRARYRQSVLDIGWSFITPALTLAAYGIVFTGAFGVDGDGIPYLSFAWCGLVAWTFFAGGVMSGTFSLVAAADIVRKVAFPREVVPLAATLANGLDLGMGLAVLGVLMVLQGVGFSITAVAAVAPLALLLLWTAALAILLGTATAFVRDLAHGVGIVVRVGIMVTPVMYPPSDVPERFQWAVTANPVATAIEGLRDSLLRHDWPDWPLLGAHAAVGIVLLGLALVYVRRVEGNMADVI